MSISENELEQLERLAALLKDYKPWAWDDIVGTDNHKAYIAYANPERIGRLVADYKRMREDLVVQWEHNHAEHCQLDHSHGDECHWEVSVALGGDPDAYRPY